MANAGKSFETVRWECHPIIFYVGDVLGFTSRFLPREAQFALRHRTMYLGKE